MTRTIVLHNNTSRDGDYALFMSYPRIHCEDIGAMHHAAWIARYIPAGKCEEIELDEDVHLWHTTQTTRFAPGTVLNGGRSELVELGTPSAYGASFTTTSLRGHNMLAPLAPSAKEGAFSVSTQPYPAGQELLGIGKRADDGTIVPVFAFQASPGFDYSIAPQPTLYIARFEGIKPGQLVDLRSAFRKAKISFEESSNGKKQAIVTALASGKFDVEYRDPIVRRAARQPVLGARKRSSYGAPTSLRERSLASRPSVGILSRTPSFYADLNPRERWSGSIMWPCTAQTIAVVQGSGMVIDSLSCKYGWSVLTTQTDEGGVNTRVWFWLLDGQQPDYLYEKDWRAAVNGLKELGVLREAEVVDEGVEQEDSGPKDLGCWPNTPHGSFARLPVFSR